MSTKRSLFSLTLLLPICVAGCGSKTALLASCRFDLEPLEPEIIFVLDASGSTMPSRLSDVLQNSGWAWEESTAAVTSITSSTDRTVPFGALLFPLHGDDPNPVGGVIEECAVAPALGVEPRFLAAEDIRAYLGTAPPAGGNSPITPALHVALEFVQSHPTTRRRVIVFVSDGLGDCNGDVPCETCECGFSDCCAIIPRGGWNCLDDAGPVREIADLHRSGAETAIVGIRQQHPAAAARQQSVLEEAASAGAFGAVAWVHEGGVGAAIEDAVSRARRTCRFRVPDRLFGDRTAIDVGTMHVEHGAANGWEWIDDSRSEIVLNGEPCARYRESGARASITLAPYQCERLDGG